ncbi:MAG: DUF3168 domain-containing protein [Sphingobium sp.]|nr:DUF3168 domain-containing protein [Sphingobium sp.]
MSGELILRAAMLAALRGDAALSEAVNSIDDGDPVKASAPWLRLGESNMTGWGARGVDGMTVRLSVLLAVRGDEEAATSEILERVDVVLGGMAPGLDAGWRITSLRRERARVARRQNEWRASADYAVRMARLV